MRTFLAAAVILLAACETTEPTPASEDPAAGMRREPCGGGPVFPPEMEPKTTGEQPLGADPAPQSP